MIGIKRKYVLLIGIAAVWLFSNCYDIVNNYSLSITNKLNSNISVLYSYDVKPEENENNIAYYVNEDNITKPDSTMIIGKSGGEEAWHDYIQQGVSKELFLYVFELDTLNKYNETFSVNNLVEQHKYLKLLHYSEDELKKMNWKVVVRK